MFYEKDTVLRCDALDLPSLHHGFATRNGGVSTGCFSSMNLGYNRGDEREAVAQNYQILGQYTGVHMKNLMYLKQVHSGVVCIADAGRSCLYQDGDALITMVPEMPLACFYADCMPVLVYDTEKNAIAAIHSGWRGTAAGVITNTIFKMKDVFGTNPKNLIAAVGPSIGSCHMEVGSEVEEQFMKCGFQNISKRGNRLFLDLWEIARLQLLKAGVPEEQINIAKICTYCNEESYFSHRRDGAQRGNHCAVIELVSAQ